MNIIKFLIYLSLLWGVVVFTSILFKCSQTGERFDVSLEHKGILIESDPFLENHYLLYSNNEISCKSFDSTSWGIVNCDAKNKYTLKIRINKAYDLREVLFTYIDTRK